MKKLFCTACLSLMLVFFVHAQKMSNSLLLQFKQYITGDFNNQEQVIAEIKKGKQIHPLAIHVNREFTKKISEIPDSMKGFFLLEESYYLNENKPLDIKPYLFYFSQASLQTINLQVFQFPVSVPKEKIRNDNDSLKISFKNLIPSPTFKGAMYSYDAIKKSFETVSINVLSSSLTFTLTESLQKDILYVMELLEKDGKSITTYNTPIIYKRNK